MIDIDQRFSQLAKELFRRSLLSISELLHVFRTAWKGRCTPRIVEYVYCTYDWTAWLTDGEVQNKEFTGIWGARRGKHKVTDLQRAHLFEWTRTGTSVRHVHVIITLIPPFSLGDEVRMDYMQFASDVDHYDDADKYWNRDGITIFDSMPPGRPSPAKLDSEFIEEVSTIRRKFEGFYEMNNRVPNYFSEVALS